MRAHAVIFPDRLKVEYREVTVPDPGPNDVVVQTRYSWISNGTEGSFLRGERINGETPYRPGDPWPFPIAPGYQSTGVVMHVGGGIEDLPCHRELGLVQKVPICQHPDRPVTGVEFDRQGNDRNSDCQREQDWYFLTLLYVIKFNSNRRIGEKVG